MDFSPAWGDGLRALVLLEGNVILVFDLAKRAVVFKAKYADATDSIQSLYFLSEKIPSVQSVSPAQLLLQESVPNQPLDGFLLLVEIKLIQKDSGKSKSGGTMIRKSKHIRKLHLVQMIQE